MKTSVLFFLLLSWATVINAEDLVSVYQKTMQNNDEYKASLMDTQAKEEEKWEAISAFLPRAEIKGLAGKEKSTVILDDPFTYIPDLPQTFEDSSPQSIYAFTGGIVEEIFNYASWKKLNAASLVVKAMKLQEENEKQNITFTVINDYLAVLKQEAKLKYINDEKAEVNQELTSNKNKFKQGYATSLDLDQANLSLEGVTTEEQSVNNLRTLALARLSSLSGETITEVDGFKKNLPLSLPTPGSVSDWEETAYNSNYALRAEKLKLAAAAEANSAENAKAYPVVYAEADYSHEQTNVPVFGGATINTKQVLLGVKAPVFAGGYFLAKREQLKSEYQKYYYEYSDSIKEINLSIEEVVIDLNNLHEKLKLDEASINMANTALAATNRSYKLGLKNLEGVLTMQDKVAQEQENYINDFYNYILLKLKLKQLGGELNANVVKEINSYFIT